jgi:hypothetical protein
MTVGANSSVSLPYYADYNTPPAGTYTPPTGYVLATSNQVENSAYTGAMYDAVGNAWIVPVSANQVSTTVATSSSAQLNAQASAVSSTPVQLPQVVITAKKLKKSAILPNPLNSYASYTYGWTLWYLDPSDLNALQGYTEVGQSTGFVPTAGTSFVVAEDGGRYISQRVPVSSGLNYQIQTVNFSTHVAPSKAGLGTNLIGGSMTIREPYGCTLIDTLALTAFGLRNAGSPSANYLDLPYLLQLDFFGYDDNGDPIPESQTAIFRKYFPIHLTGIKIEATTAGAEYKIDYVPIGHIALHEEYVNIPKNMPVGGATVNEFFKNLTTQLQIYWADSVSSGVALYADGISFEFDPMIGQSTIVYPKDNSFADADTQGVTVDVAKRQFNISEGTKITDLINRVLSLSSFMTEQVNAQGGANSSHTSPFNIYKVMIGCQYGAIGNTNAIQFEVFDPAKNQFPKVITYKIHQFVSFMGNHPAIDQAPDSTPFTVKAYNYWYTGKNTEIINLKINFDTTAYTQVLSWTDIFPGYQPLADEATDQAVKSAINIGPSMLGILYPSLTNIPSVTPTRYIGIVNDMNITTWGGLLNAPEAQTNADILKSLHSRPNGDMCTVDLQILGDPHLIKQDDWFVIPSPKDGSYNIISNSDFATKYGWLPMDTGDVIVSLTVNTPIDQDADITGQGLMYWEGGTATPSKSLFSGQYKITTINNKFENGKFEQTLKLVRYPNQDIAAAIAKLQDSRSSAVGTSSGNQLPSVSPNSASVNTGSSASVANR